MIFPAKQRAISGAVLLYGDGILTPPISVPSAIEGLEIATETTKPFIVPLTCSVLVALFLLQKRGTAGIGKVFGPVMLLWFPTIGTAGMVEILQSPRILSGLDPRYAWKFFAVNRLRGFVVLDSVVLCITGAEALCADRLPLDAFLSDLGRHRLSRVRGTAVFMPLSPVEIPPNQVVELGTQIKF